MSGDPSARYPHKDWSDFRHGRRRQRSTCTSAAIRRKPYGERMTTCAEAERFRLAMLWRVGSDAFLEIHCSRCRAELRS